MLKTASMPRISITLLVMVLGATSAIAASERNPGVELLRGVKLIIKADDANHVVESELNDTIRAAEDSLAANLSPH